MAAWGAGPFDSRGAVEILSELAAYVRRVVKDRNGTRARGGYEKARAAIQILLQMPAAAWHGSLPADVALKALQRIRDDADYLDSCEHPAGMRRQLDREIMDVRLAKGRAA